MDDLRWREVATGLWEARADHFAGAGAIHFPLRMSVLARPDGGLVLVSPVPIDDALAQAIAVAGEVGDIVAPNGLHHLHAAAAHDRYPGARLWIAPCLAKKRPDLLARGRVLEAPPIEWAPAISVHPLRGAPQLDELLLLHRPSRTLITTDLVFNIQGSRGWLMPLVLRMTGGWKRLAQTRLMRAMLRDRAAARDSLSEILALDFERLVMAHGEVIEQDGRARLAEALAWLVPAPTRSPVSAA